MERSIQAGLKFAKEMGKEFGHVPLYMSCFLYSFKSFHPFDFSLLN